MQYRSLGFRKNAKLSVYLFIETQKQKFTVPPFQNTLLVENLSSSPPGNHYLKEQTFLLIKKSFADPLTLSRPFVNSNNCKVTFKITDKVMLCGWCFLP